MDPKTNQGQQGGTTPPKSSPPVKQPAPPAPPTPPAPPAPPTPPAPPQPPMPPQGAPQGAYPPGMYPPGAYPQGAYPPPGYPPYDPNMYAAGGYPPPYYPPYPPQGGYPPQGAYPPGYSPQGMPPGAYPPAPGMPGQGMPPVSPEDATPANFQLGTKLPAKLTVKAPKHTLNFDEEYFIRLLAGSISLSKDEKKRIVESIPKLKQSQIDELIRIFEEEKQKFAALSKKHVPQLQKLVDQHYKEWMDLETEMHQDNKKKDDTNKAEEIRKKLGI